MKFLTILLLSFSALGQTVSAPNVTLSEGGFEAVITAQEFNDLYAAYQFNVTYDPSVISLRYQDEAHNFGCSLQNTIDSNMAVVCNGYEAGRLRVVVYGAYGFSGSGDLLRTSWVYAGGSTPLHFENARFFLWTGETKVTTIDGSVTQGNSVWWDN